jgi:MFS family permease
MKLSPLKISLLFIATLTVMSGITIVSTLPLISQNFSHIPNIDFYSKMLLTIPAIVVALFAPFVGVLVDKVGRLKPLYVGIALFVIGGSSGFYLDNFWMILAGRAVLGVAVALLMTTSIALIGDYFEEEERHQYMSLQGMAVGVGGILFISAGGFLADYHYSYPFAIYLIPLLFVPFIVANLYEPTRHKVADTKTQQKSLWPIYATGFFVMVLFYMLPTQFPYLIMDQLKGDPSDIGMVIAASMLINAIAAMQYAKLKAIFGFTKLFAIIFLLFGIGLMVIAVAETILHLYASTIFMGIGFGLTMVNINAWLLSEVEASKRGKATGKLTSAMFLGQFFSPILFEPIVVQIEIQGLFMVMAFVVWIVSAVIFAKLKMSVHQA